MYNYNLYVLKFLNLNLVKMYGEKSKMLKNIDLKKNSRRISRRVSRIRNPSLCRSACWKYNTSTSQFIWYVRDRETENRHIQLIKLSLLVSGKSLPPSPAIITR